MGLIVEFKAHRGGQADLYLCLEEGPQQEVGPTLGALPGALAAPLWHQGRKESSPQSHRPPLPKSAGLGRLQKAPEAPQEALLEAPQPGYHRIN